MRTRYWTARMYVLALGALSFMVMGGCGLTDQQFAQIWESVISSALSTIVSTALETAAAG